MRPARCCAKLEGGLWAPFEEGVVRAHAGRPLKPPGPHPACFWFSCIVAKIYEKEKDIVGVVVKGILFGVRTLTWNSISAAYGVTSSSWFTWG